MSDFTWAFPAGVPATPAVTTVAEGDVDHVQEAIDRLPTQYTSDAGVTTLLAALARPAQALEDTLQDMLLNRAVDTAEGAQLDIIGKLVGQARGGQLDDVYRRYIRARIKTSRSKGIVEDLIRIATLVIDDLDARIWVDQQGIAGVNIVVQDAGIDEDTAAATILFLRLAVAAGVRVIIESSPSPPDETFEFDEDGPGADNGCAAILLADFATNIDSVVRARDPGPDGDSFTLTLVGDGTGAGELDDDGNGNFTVHFEPGVTTAGDVDALIDGDTSLAIEQESSDGDALLAAIDDEFGPESLTGGGDVGGDLSDART